MAASTVEKTAIAKALT